MEPNRRACRKALRVLVFLSASCVACVSPSRQALEASVRKEVEADIKAKRDQEHWQRSYDAFYVAHPELRGREQCVLRTLHDPPPKTWGTLAVESRSRCLLAPNWVKVFVAPDGKGTYVDASRLEPRQGNQITFWEANEVFDKDMDFLAARCVVDCDKGMTAVLQTAAVVGGHYGESYSTPLDWTSVLPNSQGEAVLKSVCAARATMLSRKRKRPAQRKEQPAPSPTPVPAPVKNDKGPFPRGI